MEVVGAIVSSVLTEPFRVLFGSVYGRIKNVVKIHSNYKDLDEHMKSLLELKQLLDDDELQQRHLPRSQVQDWLRKVEKLQTEFDSMRSIMVSTNGNTTGSSGCTCSLDWRLSKNIVKVLEEAKQLIGDGRALEKEIVGVNPPPKPFVYTGAPSIEGQPTASKKLAEMMDLLRNDECKRIGVWGMGGVGKTTLVKNLNNKLSKNPTNQTFDIVILVVVSQNATVESVQSKIAERLELPMNKDQSKESLADQLYDKLKGKRFLLILDDIWEGVDLDAVGIPPLEDHIGSKVILTTRKNDVCRKMWTDVEFEIHKLSDEEAWDLFSKKVGEGVVNDDHIRPLAKAIVKECDGLPLAIIVVGASLRKKTGVALWNAALYALKKSEPSGINDVEEKVYKPLKWSYDSLRCEKFKSCFLFFCLFPEDFEIRVDNLVQYWLAEGLLDEQQNHEQLQDEVVSITDYLKDSCLLEKGRNIGLVKMHDVVRDVGIWIAKSSEDWCTSVISSGTSEMQISQQLLDCSDKVKRVSVMHSNITILPDRNIECSETTTLCLQGNSKLSEVPNSFLQGFQILRTLDLSGAKIKLLPDSILQLCELRTLILRYCFELYELPPLDAFGKLQVLDCSYTGIAKLPAGFEKLTSLRMLNLSGTPKLKEIPSGKFCNLHKLEYLEMESECLKWGTRKTNEENAPFEDLLCLNQLVALYIKLKGIPCVTTQHASWFKRIKKFKFLVTHDSKGHFLNENEVWMEGHHFSVDENVGLLLVNACKVFIGKCSGVDLMLDNLGRNSAILGPFANLKILEISNCSIRKPSSSSGECALKIDFFPKLEVLSVNNMSKLRSFSDFNNFLGLSFIWPKRIRVWECHDLENLLVVDGTLQNLERVEEIGVVHCKKLTEVFKNAPSDNFVPNLKSLLLYSLPSLEVICKENASWESLKHLVVKNCTRLQKLPIGIELN